MLLEIVFFLSIFMIVYGYGGYLVLLRCLIFFKNDIFSRCCAEQYKETVLPSITLLISVYNEEDVIEKKLLNSLSLDYPLDKLEILVVSDGSNDTTNDKVKLFTSKGVKLLRQATRAGKTAALNMAVPQARGDLIVFSDANAMYEKGALRNLAQPFLQPQVGLVTGRTKYVASSNHSVSETTGLYTRLEFLTKVLESRLSSCVGADGAIFAIRKKLYQPLVDYDINDFVIPLQIIKQGYRVILAENACCIEETAQDISGEFNRQVRITCRTIRAIINNKELLNPLKFFFFSFALFSHKLIKFMLPFCLALAFVANVSLIIMTDSWFFTLSGVAQFVFYLLAVAGYLQRDGAIFRLPNLMYTFVSVGAAIFLGWLKYFSGETYTIWQSERVEK